MLFGLVAANMCFQIPVYDSMQAFKDHLSAIDVGEGTSLYDVMVGKHTPCQIATEAHRLLAGADAPSYALTAAVATQVHLFYPSIK